MSCIIKVVSQDGSKLMPRTMVDPAATSHSWSITIYIVADFGWEQVWREVTNLREESVEKC